MRNKRWVYLSLKLLLLLLLFIISYSIIDKIWLLGIFDYGLEKMWFYIAGYAFFGAALGGFQVYESSNRSGRWSFDFRHIVISLPFLYFAISFALPQYIRFPLPFYSTAAMQLSSILLGYVIVTSIKKVDNEG